MTDHLITQASHESCGILSCCLVSSYGCNIMWHAPLRWFWPNSTTLPLFLELRCSPHAFLLVNFSCATTFVTIIATVQHYDKGINHCTIIFLTPPKPIVLSCSPYLMRVLHGHGKMKKIRNLEQNFVGACTWCRSMSIWVGCILCEKRSSWHITPLTFCITSVLVEVIFCGWSPSMKSSSTTEFMVVVLS